MPIINNLAGGEVEVTKLADILTGTDYDITDAYYGDLHIFTVWGESEGALPRTFSANGDNEVEWQVYGGVDPNANLFDVNRAYSSTWTLNTSSYMIAAATVSQVYPDKARVTINNDGSITVTSYDNGYGALFLINAEPNKTYTLSFDVPKQSSGSCAAITSRKQNGDIIPDSHATSSNTSITYTTPNDTAYIAICLRFPASDGEVTYSNVMVVKGSTVPSTYVPYTDKMYCGVRTENVISHYLDNSIIDSTTSNTIVYSASYNIACVPVILGKKYSMLRTASQTPIICAFFENEPQVGSTTYNGEVPVALSGSSGTITSPVTGWMTVLTSKMISPHENMVVIEGENIPSTYIPYGYKIPVAVESGNLANNVLVNTDTSQYTTALFFDADIEPNTTYVLSFNSDAGKKFYANENLFSGKTITTVDGVNTMILTTVANIDKSKSSQWYNGRWVILKNTVTQSSSISLTNVMLNAGSTALPYQPHSHTLLPLYIGDSQLQPDEYTSYKDQKIYKYVSGVLTPTDPPVPIPALPTLNGVTVVDTELASSDVQPEKAFVKFRKMNS